MYCQQWNVLRDSKEITTHYWHVWDGVTWHTLRNRDNNSWIGRDPMTAVWESNPLWGRYPRKSRWLPQYPSVAIHLYHTAGSRSQCIPVRSRVATLVYPQKSSPLSGSYCPRTPHTSFDQTIPPLLQHFHLTIKRKTPFDFCGSIVVRTLSNNALPRGTLIGRQRAQHPSIKGHPCNSMGRQTQQHFDQFSTVFGFGKTCFPLFP